LLCAGLVLRGLQRAQYINPGFNPQNAVEVSFDLGLQGYDEARGKEFQRLTLERVRNLPGVQAAALATHIPLTLGQKGKTIFIEGAPPQRGAQAQISLSSAVSLDYFKTLETRLLQGRDFTARDEAQAPPVAVVNETFARRFWPSEAGHEANALGKRFSFSERDGKWIEVIGIAQDGKYFSLAEKTEPFVYLPLPQAYEGAVTLVARADGNPLPLLAGIRGEFRQLDATLPLYNVNTLTEHMNLPLFPARVAASVLGAFGLLALMLAALGIFGVMSYAVAQRRREIGIRIALGAGETEILKLIVGHGLWLTLIGMGVGLGLAVAGTRLLATLLFGLSATDPLTFAVIALLLALVALLACWLPARRATKVDPIEALHYE